MKVTRIGVWSAARVAALLYGGLGLLIGAFLSLAALAGAGLGSAVNAQSDVPPALLVVIGVGAIVFAPIFYGVMGLIVGSLTAALYNLAAGVVGGIELDVEN
jgi:hypothetical protein